jgi:hypothetical protein
VAIERLLVSEAPKLILNHPLMVYTPHDLGGILNSKGELWLSDSHLLKYQAQLLGGTEITLRTCQSLNPASLLPEAEGNPEHSCEEVLMENYVARPDLTDQPLKNPALELYTDGSSFVKNGVRHAGFAVVTGFGILTSGPLLPNTSAQISGPNRIPKTVKRAESKHLYRCLPDPTCSCSYLEGKRNANEQEQLPVEIKERLLY